MVHSSTGIAAFVLIELTSLTMSSSAAAQAIPEDFVITLERTACFGACPVYAVRIDGNGNVTYDGTRFVRVVGRQTDRIPVRLVAALVETVDRIRFFELDDKYRQLITDLPTTFVTVTREGRSKRIEDYFGAPKTLKDLERQIDDTARTARWIALNQATLRPNLSLAGPKSTWQKHAGTARLSSHESVSLARVCNWGLVTWVATHGLPALTKQVYAPSSPAPATCQSQ